MLRHNCVPCKILFLSFNLLVLWLTAGFHSNTYFCHFGIFLFSHLNSFHQMALLNPFYHGTGWEIEKRGCEPKNGSPSISTSLSKQTLWYHTGKEQLILAGGWYINMWLPSSVDIVAFLETSLSPWALIGRSLADHLILFTQAFSIHHTFQLIGFQFANLQSCWDWLPKIISWSPRQIFLESTAS